MSLYGASLDHIAIALSNSTGTPPQLAKLFQILGIQKGISEAVPEQGVNVQFFTLPGTAPHIEFLEVSDPNGTVAKFIQKKGPGIHHLAFSLSQGSLDPLCAKLVKEGFKLTYDTPKKGAQEMRINFIHPSCTNGVLIELMEKASSGN